MKEEVLRTVNLCADSVDEHSLRQININLFKGETLSLLGLNGSGIGLFSDVLCGIQCPTGGTIEIDEKEVKIENEISARSLGIFRISRERTVIDELSIAENFFILRRNGFRNILINNKVFNSQAAMLLAQVGMRQSPTVKVGKLSIADKQLVELAKALGSGAKIVIFDESFDEYDFAEINHLKKTLEELKRKGFSFIICCYSCEEYRLFADRFVVFRDGNVVKKIKKQIPKETELYEYIIGCPEKTDKTLPLPKFDAITLAISGIKIRENDKPFSFIVHRGEILGLFWKNTEDKDLFVKLLLDGNNQDFFSFYLDGSCIKNPSLKKFAALRIVFIPCLGTEKTLFENMSISENLLFPSLKKIKGPGGFVSNKIITVLRDNFYSQHHLKGSEELKDLDKNTRVSLALERWLIYHPQVVILQDPFLLADMMISDLITSFILQLSTKGTAVLIVSSRPSRAKEICHRSIFVPDTRKEGRNAF